MAQLRELPETLCDRTTARAYNLTMIRISLFLFALLSTAPSFAQNTHRYDHSRDWAMFSDDGACWATTMQRSGGVSYFLYVTVFEGLGAPQISINASPRFQKTRGLRLHLGTRRYPMKSDGDSAWPPKESDKLIIERLSAADKQGDEGAILKIPSSPNVNFSSAGFSKAYSAILARCHLAPLLGLS